ncbi:transmembrane adaptor Erv26 [Xylaria nigripes]|nr:transmembrane adaptor Erv26 [Xylaria nigripes]
MWILPLVGYLGSVLGFCFLTLAIGMWFLSDQFITLSPLVMLQSFTVINDATSYFTLLHVSKQKCRILGSCAYLTDSSIPTASGLYYLSELVEEHTVIAKRLLTRLIYFIIGIQLVLWVIDGLPLRLTLMGVASHLVYLGNMRRFPFVRLTDPLFLTSCVLVIINHYLWFRYFSHTQQRSYSHLASMYDPSEVPSFTEIASFFGICVWLIPFALFVSLSASDNVLPTIGSEQPHDDSGKNKRQGMVKVIVDYVLSGIGEVSRLAGWRKPEEHF